MSILLFIHTSPMRQHSAKDRKTETVVDKKKSLPCVDCPLVDMGSVLWQSWNKIH